MRFASFNWWLRLVLAGWPRGAGLVGLLALVAAPVLAQPASLPEPRTGAAAVTLDGFIYVVGGTDARGRVHETMLRYDPAFDRWTELEASEVARTNVAAVAARGKLYVLGGRRENGNATNHVEVYDPAEDEWEGIDNMRERRAGLAAVVVDDRIYAIGGVDDLEGRRHAVEYYDLSSDDEADDGSAADESDDASEDGKWQVLEAWVFPTPLVSLVAVPVNGSIYAIGGFAPLAGPLAAATRYDVGSGVATAGGLQAARGALAAAVVDGSIYVSGGLSRLDVPVATVDVLDTRTGRWSLAPPLAVARYDHTSVAVGDEVYVIGGRGLGDRTLASVERIERTDTARDPDEQPAQPTLQIEGLYPMPMRTSVMLTYVAHYAAPVAVRIYDLEGRLVWHRTDQALPGGRRSIPWDGLAADGYPVASGVYLVRLQQGEQHATRLLHVVR